MSVKSFFCLAVFAAVNGHAASTALAQISIPTVPIGNPGNAADSASGNRFGSVAYTYNIGKYEVTNAQYAAFLNAVARTDTYNLYNRAMGGWFGGITRAGSPGSYTYSTVSSRANHPVEYVSFWDATRFANWLHNGQPTGPQNNSTTENGAYTLTAGVISADSVTRNTGWKWAVASENEWYKAAYHQPASQGGDHDNYWLYATSSNTINTSQSNFKNVIGDSTPVGSYAANFYGTFDMSGNVWELNESIVSGALPSFRGGGYGDSDESYQQAGAYGEILPREEFRGLGFRVVQIPGPSSVALFAIVGLTAARRRR